MIIDHTFGAATARPTAHERPCPPQFAGAATPAAAHWLTLASRDRGAAERFERHVLELRSLGAPADLVHGADDAIIDKLRHAQLYLELASHGRLIPSPKAVSPALGAQPILHRVLVNGCLRDTVHALLVHQASESAQAPRVMYILQAIASDASRHAALAWRTLTWGLRVFPHVRDTLVPALYAGLSQLPRATSVPRIDGALDSQTFEQARQDAVEYTVLPTFQSLMDRATPSPCDSRYL